MLHEMGLDVSEKFLSRKGWEVLARAAEKDGDGFDLVARDECGDLHFIDVITLKADTAFSGFKPAPPDEADVERRMFAQIGEFGGSDDYIAYDRIELAVASGGRGMLRHDINVLAG